MREASGTEEEISRGVVVEGSACAAARTPGTTYTPQSPTCYHRGSCEGVGMSGSCKGPPIPNTCPGRETEGRWADCGGILRCRESARTVGIWRASSAMGMCVDVASRPLLVASLHCPFSVLKHVRATCASTHVGCYASLLRGHYCDLVHAPPTLHASSTISNNRHSAAAVPRPPSPLLPSHYAFRTCLPRARGPRRLPEAPATPRWTQNDLSDRCVKAALHHTRRCWRLCSNNLETVAKDEPRGPSRCLGVA